MRLTNEFVVAAPPEVVWAHLLDMEGVAECVPGARIEEVVPPDTYKGKIRLKVGPMTVEYRGQATLVEVDEANRQATIQMKAREARGQGSAVATVRNRLEAVPGGTKVVAETDLDITGPQAQFGKGVLEDVGGRVLEEFTVRLERRIASAGSTEPSAAAESNGTGTARPSAAAPEEEDSLDLNRMIGASLRDRAKTLAVAAGAGGFVVVLLVLLARRRRRRASRR